MNTIDFEYGKFALKGGKIYVDGKEVCDLPNQPTKQAGGDAVYVIDSVGDHKCLVVIISSGRHANQIFPAVRHEYDGYKLDIYCEDDKRIRVTQFGPYQYPHEDSNMTFLNIETMYC